MNTPNEQEMMQIITQIMTDDQVFPMTIDVRAAWLILSSLQLTVRHPGTSSWLDTQIIQIGRTFQERLVELHPEIEPIAEMGWDGQYDVSHEDSE